MSVIGLGNSVNKYLDLVLQRSSVSRFILRLDRFWKIQVKIVEVVIDGTADFTKEHHRNVLDLKY